MLTAVLGQLISNMATALIVIPVASRAGAGHRRLGPAGADVRDRRCRSGVAHAVATPANLMVMEPGGYRFGDYWKLGLPLLVLYGVVAVLLVPVIWEF